MSNKKTKKNGGVPVSLSEFKASVREQLLAGRQGLPRGCHFGDDLSDLQNLSLQSFSEDVALALDVELMENAFSVLDFGPGVEGQLGVEQMGGAEHVMLKLLGSKSKVKLVLGKCRKYGIRLPNCLQPRFIPVTLKGVPFIPSLLVQDEERTRSLAFEWVVLNAYSNDPEDHGATAATTDENGNVVEIYDGDESFNPSTGEKEDGKPVLPYARHRWAHSIVGWKDNKSYQQQSVEENQVMTYTGQDGKEYKVTAVYVASSFPLVEQVVDDYGNAVKFHTVSKRVLLHDVIQDTLSRALGGRRESWAQFRALVALSKEFRQLLGERKLEDLPSGNQRYWVLRKQGIVLMSPVAFSDLSKAAQEEITRRRAFWSRFNAIKEAVLPLLEKAEALSSKEDEVSAVQLGEVVRKAHKAIVDHQAWFLFKRLKPWYSIIFADRGETDLSSLLG